MGLITYFKNLHNKNFHLTMTILCRNECDIIKENILFHRYMGIDSFVVMDNNSTDGTKDVLKDLQKKVPLIVIDEKGFYQQAKWMYQLTKVAQKQFQPHLIVNNDADEFWYPKNGKNIKEYLSARDTVVTVRKFNMVPTTDIFLEDFKFWQLTQKIYKKIQFTKEQEINDSQINILLANVSPKVITNPNGLIKISGGNHRAKHWLAFLNARVEENISIYHFPIRNFQRFEENIIHRKTMLDKGLKAANHYRRWIKSLQKGELEIEFKHMLNSLNKSVVERDDSIKTIMEKLIEKGVLKS